ncbi:class I SAM-dependent methyltransferase [Pseudarthrobacter sp. O4]|uniref:class I SAM-dependent methyltransferase n=1 Tax=Pseudarthrobacter sp. O4 TaxID=3418417 RepID=UPI003CF8AC95
MGPIPERYSIFAPLYDVLSAEFPIYRAGRVLGIAAMAPRMGDQVLDVGCGTGLNFPLLQAGIGETGTIVGLDSSADMLRQARRRATKRGWNNVILLQSDAATLDPAEVAARVTAAGGQDRSDAAIASYALSLMPQWPRAWDNMRALCRPGAMLSVVDMQDPVGAAALFTPLARLACRLGGADIAARPWQAVERDCTGVLRATARGGHLQIRAGRSAADASEPS